MELTTKNGVTLLDLVNPFSSSKVPHHAKSSEITGKVQRLVGMKTGCVDLFLLSSLGKDFIDPPAVPQDPGFIIRRAEEVCTILHVFDTVDTLRMCFFCYAFLFLQLSNQSPNGEVSCG